MNRKILQGSAQRLRSRQGQAAVVIILVIAIALILYAVVLNMNRIAQIKSQTLISSNIAASQLASSMASYGEAVLQTSLGGRTERCGFTAVLAIFIVILIIIISIVLAPFTGGSSLGLLSTIPAIIGAALLLASLVLQLTVIQPGLTAQWNRMMSEQLMPLDDFVERGIQAGLGSIISDEKMIPDKFDFDGDGVYVDLAQGLENDFISRFGIYYTERLKKIEPRTGADVRFFINALDRLLHVDNSTNDFGFWDKPLSPHPCGDFDSNNSNSPNKPSLCDPCCVPLTFGPVPPPPDTNRTRPECCDHIDPDQRCGSAASCGARSGTGWADPFPAPPLPSNDYKFIFETQYVDNESNSLFSFREFLGRDDEVKVYEKNSADPNGAQNGIALPGAFQLKDTTGYYRTPAYGPPEDNRTGLYSFLYKMADWAPDINTSAANLNLLKCHWCDANSGIACPPTMPVELPRPVLYGPLNPLSGGWCVERNNVAGQKALRPDNVGIINKSNTIDRWIPANDDFCADDPIASPLWKKGADRYCSKDWPHAGNCPKHIAGGSGACDPLDPDYPYNCTCAETDSTNRSLWPDDTLDGIVYGIPEFIAWAHAILLQDPADLGLRLPEWYPSAADWIEPSGSLMNFPEDGALLQWRKAIGAWRDVFRTWLNDPRYQDDSWGTAPEGAWCYPNLSTRYDGITHLDKSRYMSDREAAVIDAARPDTIDKVLACLDWNANHQAAPGQNGNAWKFYRCGNKLIPSDGWGYCMQNWTDICGQLPRSLLPVVDFDQTAPVAAPDIVYFSNIYVCQASCGVNPSCNDVATRNGYSAWNQTWCNAYIDGGGNTIAWGPGHIIYEYLTQLLLSSTGVCLQNLTGGPWQDDVWNSALAAANQVEKFRKRLSFLKGSPYASAPLPWGRADNLVQRAKDAWWELDKAYTELTAFLVGGDGSDTPGEQLTDLMRGFGVTQPPLPSQAVYAWKSDPPSEKWHIARVDVRIPQRCGTTNACGPAGNSPDSAWPTITSRTISWGTRRCYSLQNWYGSVKARVTRFDEDKAPGILNFPSGEKIWDFRYYNPLAPRAADVDNRISNACLRPPCDLELPTARNAFIIGSRNDCQDGKNCGNRCVACWDTVNDILRSGVTTETCAEYFLKDEGYGGTHFHIKFIKCKNFD